jgi:hypothetical protein
VDGFGRPELLDVERDMIGVLPLTAARAGGGSSFWRLLGTECDEADALRVRTAGVTVPVDLPGMYPAPFGVGFPLASGVFARAGREPARWGWLRFASANSCSC